MEYLFDQEITIKYNAMKLKENRDMLIKIIILFFN